MKNSTVQSLLSDDTINSSEAQPNTDHPDIEGGWKGGQADAGKVSRYSAG